MADPTILWLNSDDNLNKPERERWVMVDGRKVQHKFPQHGHTGEDWRSRRHAPGDRFIRVVNHHGNIVNWVLTNGAAHLDPNTGWGQQQLAKARHHGCYGLGQCPCALIASKHLLASQFLDPGVREALPCPPNTYSQDNPCPHAIAEREARLKETAAINAEREARHKNNETKLLEMQREQMQIQMAAIEAQRKQTEALIAAVGLKTEEKVKSK